MYILQKKSTKTVNPALSSGLNFFPPPIWGHHHQLDDQQRNPNMNNRDHLVGQLTNALSALDRDMDVYVTNLVNKGQNLGHTQKQLVTLLYITIDLRRGQ